MITVSTNNNTNFLEYRLVHNFWVNIIWGRQILFGSLHSEAFCAVLYPVIGRWILAAVTRYDAGYGEDQRENGNPTHCPGSHVR